MFWLLLPTGALAQNYRINVASFPAAFGADNVRRTAESAAAAWSWAAGTNSEIRIIGTTTAVGCPLPWEDSNIHAVAGCETPSCSTLARHFVCPTGSSIRVYLGAATFTLDPPNNSTAQDLHQLLQHEFGHRHYWKHVNTERCVMSSLLLPGNTSQRYFCRDELRAIRSGALGWWGWWHLPMKFLASTSYSNPTSSPWNINDVTPINTPAGRGFMDFERGAIESQIFAVGVPNSDLRSSPYPLINSNEVTGSAIMRPTVAYDHTRHRWWVFFRPDTALGSNGVNVTTSLFPNVQSSYSTITPVMNGSTGRIRTRMPVGAAYDQRTDRIVVLFARWTIDGGLENGRLSVVSTPAGGTGGTWSSESPLDTVVRAVGPPTLACEASASTLNCQAIFNGSDVGLRVWTFGFSLLSNGALANTSPYANNNFRSDYPLGLTANGVDLETGPVGRFVAAAREARTENVFVMSKSASQVGWPQSWTNTSIRTGPAGTPIRISQPTQDYHIFYTPR
jgi:hypothetical protein